MSFRRPRFRKLSSDRQTDKQTDRQTGPKIYAASRIIIEDELVYIMIKYLSFGCLDT